MCVAQFVYVCVAGVFANEAIKSEATTASNVSFAREVAPILVKRCIACHGQTTPLRLEPLAPGRTTWTEEESRKNFQAIQRVVAPRNLKSKLLLHPLEEKAGGDFYHNGGKHFASQNDPEWLTLKAWVMGQTAKK